MAFHQRVLKLRAESGVGPPRPSPPEQEEEAERDVRLGEMQRESLGSKRRERISREDFPENRHSLVSQKKLDAARLSNRPGTKENEQFQANQGVLKEWNNAWEDLEYDGTVEEQFDDIEHGQAHRSRIMTNLENGEEETRPSLRRHHADDGGRARGGGRGGRGGGFAGSRSRVNGLKRVPVGIPTPLQHLGTATQASLPPHEGDHTSGARSLTRGGSRSQGSLGSTRGGASSQGLSSSSHRREPSAPTGNPASPSRPVRPPRESGWEFRLAEPSVFMKASKEILALSSNVDPVAKSNTAPAKPTSPSLANPLTTIEAAAQTASPPYSASNSSIAKQATVDAATNATNANATNISAPHSAIRKLAEAGAAPSSQEPYLKPRTKTTREPDSAASQRAAAATLSKAGPWGKRPVERDPGWPVVSPGAGRDTGSSLIDFGDASNQSQKEAFSHQTGGEAKAVQTTSTSPRSEKSYSGDLLGLNIQPVSQTRAPQEPRSNSASRTSSTPSIADIHTQLSSLVPLLKDALQPELIKSYESIISKLHVRSKGAARTREAAPDMEPPTEAFGRLSIRDDAAVPKPISKDRSPALVDRAKVDSPPPPKVDESIFITLKPSSIERGSQINHTGYLGRITAAPKPSVTPLAKMSSSGVSTRSTSVPAKQSAVEIPGVVESRSQRKTHQPASAPSMIVKADEVDKVKEEEKDYPLDAILKTTFVPSGPSMLNQGGFYKR